MRRATITIRTPGVMVALALVLTATSCSSADDSEDVGIDRPDGPTVVIGAQELAGNELLAQIYGRAIAGAGYPVENKDLGGHQESVFEAFADGDINFAPQYAASMLGHLDGGSVASSGDINAAAALLRDLLSDRGLVGLDVSPAAESTVFVVTPETAQDGGLTTLSGLADGLRLGGRPDCPTNPTCLPAIRDALGIDFSGTFVPLDGGGARTEAALQSGEIDVAVMSSTDPAIADRGWVVLADDTSPPNPDNVIVVTTDEVVDAYGSDFVLLVDNVSAALTSDTLESLGRRVSGGSGAGEVAREWLVAQGLLVA